MKASTLDVAIMNFIRAVFLCSAFLVAIEHGAAFGNIKAGYIPGIGGMTPINEASCVNNSILHDRSLSSSLECARTCIPGEKPRTCYYRFHLERYPINGRACSLCSPNITNLFCPNCQCVPADGVERMALTVNRMIPGPSIQVCEGDRLVIDVVNLMDGEAVTIHWHGLFQEGTQYYDGVPYVTQCPIQFTDTFRYQFLVANTGTHFWHAHTGLHKMDGIYGSIIVREPARQDPTSCFYKYDLASHVILISDWMHEETTGRFPGRITGVTGQTPDSLLINGRGRYTNSDGSRTNITLEVFTVEPNQRYRFRLINAFCGFCGTQLTVEGHRLTVIATDGQPIIPVEVDSIISFSAERYDFIINANQSSGSYWIQLRGIFQCNGMQQLAILQYAGASPTPSTPEPAYTPGLPLGVILNPVDVDCNKETKNAICLNELRHALPVNEDIVQEKPDVRLNLTINSHIYTPEEAFRPNAYPNFFDPAPNVIAAAMISNISFKTPPAPPLSQLTDIPKGQFCNSENLPSNCNGTFCKCTHLIEIKLNAVVEVALIDTFGVPNTYHPFHLHGFHYNIISMGQPFGPTLNATKRMTVEAFQELERNNQLGKNLDYPPGKDTVPVPNNGYVIFRFRAVNPGYWLFHCHFVFHQKVGMQLIFHVGKQKDLPKVPSKFPKCGNYVPKIISENDINEDTNEEDKSNSENKDDSDAVWFDPILGFL